MKRTLPALPLLLFGPACASGPGFASAPYFAAADEAPAIDTGPYHNHSIRPIVGGTTERAGSGFTLVGQYEYRLTRDWGVGAFADITFGDETDFVLGGAGYRHPVENLTRADLRFAPRGQHLRLPIHVSKRRHPAEPEGPIAVPLDLGVR